VLNVFWLHFFAPTVPPALRAYSMVPTHNRTADKLVKISTLTVLSAVERLIDDVYHIYWQVIVMNWIKLMGVTKCCQKLRRPSKFWRLYSQGGSCNILSSRFQTCSRFVKTRLFQTYCVCLFGSAWLWTTFTSRTLQLSCFNKCVKRFFGYAKYDSVMHFANLGIANAQSRLLN